VKRSAIKRKSRKASKTLRIYGGKKRIEFVKSLPCAACGVVGFSENAHVAPSSEKGTGYKAGFEWIVPLCRARSSMGAPFGGMQTLNITIGCHATYDRTPWVFRAAFPDFNAEKAAQQTEELWQSHLKEKGK